MGVHFFKADVTYRVKKSSIIKEFINKQFEKQTGKKISLNCILCSDEYLLNINRQFLQHDYYTDIITFPLEENDNKVFAEIYISIERIADNATKNMIDNETEFNRVLFHGVLHLCGFNDKTKTEKQKMDSMEDLWLKKFVDYSKKRTN